MEGRFIHFTTLRIALLAQFLAVAGIDGHAESSQIAEARVVSLTGLTQNPVVRNSVLSKNDDVPITSERIAGKACWSAEFKSISLRLPSVPTTTQDENKRNFTVLILSSTGQFVSIRQHSDSDNSDSRQPVDVESSIKALSNMGEVWESLPKGTPKVTFVQALDSIESSAVGSPYHAKEICGYLVIASDLKKPARPVWMITMTGYDIAPEVGQMPDLHTDFLAVPSTTYQQMRYVVDAVSGKCLRVTAIVPGINAK